MTVPSSDAYAREILDYLLGRLERNHLDDAIAHQRAPERSSDRLLSWWLFEGKRYPGMEGPLAGHWSAVQRQVRRLLTSYNETWRVVHAPEGQVDWLASALLQAGTQVPTYLTRASRAGLSQEEYRALVGWRAWMTDRWNAYVAQIRPPAGVDASLPWPTPSSKKATLPELRRWAHTAHRSRWPLLRNIVAQMLRCLLEPQVLERLPLPTDPPRLFELLCLREAVDVRGEH